MLWLLLIAIVLMILFLNTPKKAILTQADIIDKNERIFKFDVKGLQVVAYRKNLEKCEVGDEVELIEEPTNIYDPNAIKVICNNLLLGYVPKEETTRVLKLSKEMKCALVEYIYQTQSFAECTVGIHF